MRCGGGAKWVLNSFFFDLLKGMIQIHEQIFQLGWNEPLPTVVVFLLHQRFPFCCARPEGNIWIEITSWLLLKNKS